MASATIFGIPLGAAAGLDLVLGLDSEISGMGAAMAELATFAATYTLVLAIPGPNFVMVMEAGIDGSLRAVLTAAAGIAFGASLLSALAMTSALSLGPAGSWMPILQVVFATTLCLIGVKALRRSLRRGILLDRSLRLTLTQQFAAAFSSALCNPTTALFFVSSATGLGLTTLRSHPALIPGIVFLIAIGWWSFVGAAFCLKPAHACLQLIRRPMEAILGACLIAFGLFNMTQAATGWIISWSA